LRTDGPSCAPHASNTTRGAIWHPPGESSEVSQSRSGDRVKTNRRDSVTLVKLLRAGELRAIWVLDSVHEAVRDLTRAREAAMLDLKKKRQQLLGFLLRHGRIFPGGKNWTCMNAGSRSRPSIIRRSRSFSKISLR
jgi:hypothetical protein